MSALLTPVSCRGVANHGPPRKASRDISDTPICISRAHMLHALKSHPLTLPSQASIPASYYAGGRVSKADTLIAAVKYLRAAARTRGMLEREAGVCTQFSTRAWDTSYYGIVCCGVRSEGTVDLFPLVTLCVTGFYITHRPVGGSLFMYFQKGTVCVYTACSTPAHVRSHFSAPLDNLSQISRELTGSSPVVSPFILAGAKGTVGPCATASAGGG